MKEISKKSLSGAGTTSGQLTYPVSLTLNKIYCALVETSQGIDSLVSSSTVIASISYTTSTSVYWYIKNNATSGSAVSNVRFVFVLGA